MPTETVELDAPIEAPDADLTSVFNKTLPDPDLEKVETKTETKKPEKKDAVKTEKKEEIVTPDLPETAFSEVLGAEKSEEKKEAVEPEPTEIPENIKSETARESFKKLDQRRIDAEKKAIELERKAKELETKVASGDPDAKARIIDLENKLKSADGLVQKALLQEHPDFQARYVVPRQQLMEQAQSAFKDGGGDPQQLEVALALKGKARADKLDELFGDIGSKTLLGKVERAVDSIERIDTEKEMVLKNSSEYYKRVQQQDQVKRHKLFEEHEKVTKQNLSDATVVLRDKFNIGLFKPNDDPKYSWWNDEIKKMDSEAEQIMLRTEDQKEVAVAAKMAVAFPRAWKLFLEEHKARVALQKKLSEYEDTEPRLGGSGAPRTSVTEEEDVPLAKAILASVKNAQQMG